MNMNNKSFTLIELLVVIVIIGILAGVIMISTSSSINKANIAKSKVFEESVANDLAANMVSRWTLDEINGVTTPDSWGSNTGTLGDGLISTTYPTLKLESDCISGKCMSFDGGDYISVNTPNNLGLRNEITLSLWMQAFSSAPAEGFGVAGNNYWSEYSYGIMLWPNLYFKIFNDSGTANSTTTKPIQLKKWYYVVSTYNKTEISNNMKLYVDSKLEGVGNSISVHAPVEKFYIGATRFDYRKFNGLIDDVKIYDAVLSSAQIKQNYVADLNSMLANGNISKEEYNQRIETLGANF